MERLVCMLCHVLPQAWRRVRTSDAAAKPPVRDHTSMPAPETGAVERALPNGRHDARPRAWRTIQLRLASGRIDLPGLRPRQRQWTRHHDGFPHLRHTPIEGRVTLSEAGLLARGSSSGTAFPTGILGSPISGFSAPTRRSQLRGQPRLASGFDTCRFRRSLLISRLAPGRTTDNASGDRGRPYACQWRRAVPAFAMLRHFRSACAPRLPGEGLKQQSPQQRLRCVHPCPHRPLFGRLLRQVRES